MLSPPVPARAELVLDADLAGADDPIENLSAAARVGDTLFLGSDEGVRLERLLWDGTRWRDHERIALGPLLGHELAGEADIEGLAADGGWLWVLGSHARTRPKVRRRDGDRIDLAVLAGLNDTRPRCLLARVPLVESAPGRFAPVARDGSRRAGMLKLTDRGNALARAVARSPLLRPFTRVPAKEGGVDLEGVAVADGRLAIGMRGPVIQGNAVLLESGWCARPGGRLRLTGPLYHRLLALDGLGIRDLKRHGRDLLILAGPTTALDGPVFVYRWRGWADDPPRDEQVVRLHRPERATSLAFGEGDDHPEGLALVDGADGPALLVIPDGPAAHRRVAPRTIACDVVPLPA